MNYYPRYPGDYLAKTLDLTMVEDGAYTRLIDWYYSNERPIAHERRYVVSRATTPAERQAVDSVLTGFFERDGDVWRHDRIDEEISKASVRIGTAKANGSRGGRPKKNPPDNPPGSRRGNPKGNPPDNPTANPAGFPERTRGESSPSPTPENSTNNLTLTAARDGSELPGGDPPPDDPPPDPPDPTPAGRLGMAMREVGLHPSRINAHDPVALALLQRGVTVEQFAEAVRDAIGKRRGDPWRYALTVLERRVTEAAEIAAGPAVAPDPMAWRKTFEGVQRRAAELGLKPRTGEMAPDFERRVLTAHQRAASAAQGATA